MGKTKGIKDILQESSEIVPKILYRYYKFDEYTERIFKNNEVYFQSPAKFNDPFDSKITFFYKCSKTQEKKYLREWARNYRPDIYLLRKKYLQLEKKIKKEGIETHHIINNAKNDFQKYRKQMGVFCITEKKDNILMWSHYTNSHDGFCIGFNTENPFFSRARRI